MDDDKRKPPKKIKPTDADLVSDFSKEMADVIEIYKDLLQGNGRKTAKAFAEHVDYAISDFMISYECSGDEDEEGSEDDE